MQILDINQAADFLGYHPNSLRRLIKTSPELGIPYKRWGAGPKAHYRFVKEDLEAWITKIKPVEIDPRRLTSRAS